MAMTLVENDMRTAVTTSVVEISRWRYVRQYYWWYRCDDSGMYGSIIGGTDVMIAICTAASLLVQMIGVCTAVSLVVQM